MRKYLFAIPFLFFLPVTADAQTTPLENCLADLEPGEWTDCGAGPIPLVDVSELPHEELEGGFGPRGIIDSWSGAAITDTHMVFHGGGHDQWGGNETIAFNFEQLEWERWLDPKGIPEEMEVGADEFCADPYPDGTPNARHTYDGLIYDPNNNQILKFGGFPFGIDIADVCGGDNLPGGNNGSAQVWSLDLGNISDGWEPHGTRPSGVASDMGNWTTSVKTIVLPSGNILVTGRDGIAEYDPAIHEWESSTAFDPGFFRGAGTLWASADGSRYFATESETMWWSDEPPTSAAAYAKSISSHDPFTAGQGMGYHPDSGEVVVWGGGDSVFSWDLGEDSFGARTTVNPPVLDHRRVYGKFGYLEDHDVFIGYANHQDSVRFYRHDPSADEEPEPGTFVTSFDEPEHTVGEVPSGWTEHGETDGEWTVGEESGERYLNYSADSDRHHRMITWDELDDNYNFHVIGEFERMDTAQVEIMPMMRAHYKFSHPNHVDRATFYRSGWDEQTERMRAFRHWDAQFGTNEFGDTVASSSTIPDMEADGTRWCIETRVDDDRVRVRRWEKGGDNAAGPECTDGHVNENFWHADDTDPAGSAANYWQEGKIRLAGSGGLATRDRNGAYRVYNMTWNVEPTGTFARHWEQDYVPISEKPAIADARLFTDFEAGGEFESFEPATMTIEDNGLGDMIYVGGRNTGMRPVDTDPYITDSSAPHGGGEVIDSTNCRYSDGTRAHTGPYGDFSLLWILGVETHPRRPLTPIIQANLEPRHTWSSTWRCDLDENNDPVDVQLNHQYLPSTYWYAWLLTGEQWYLDKMWESAITGFTERGTTGPTGVMPIASDNPTPALNNQQRTQFHLYRDLIRLKATGHADKSPAFADYYDRTMEALLKYGPDHDPADSIRPSRKDEALDILPNYGSRPGGPGTGTTGPEDDYSEHFMYYWQPLTAALGQNLGLGADGWSDIHDWLMIGVIRPWQHRAEGHTKFYPQKNHPLFIFDGESLICEPDSPLEGQYYSNTADPQLGDLDTYEKQVEVMEECQSQQFTARIGHDHVAEGNYFPINTVRSWWQNTDQFFGVLDSYAWIGSDQAIKDTTCDMIGEMRMDYFEWFDDHTTFDPGEINRRLNPNYHYETTPDCPDDGRDAGYFVFD